MNTYSVHNKPLGLLLPCDRLSENAHLDIEELFEFQAAGSSVKQRLIAWEVHIVYSLATRNQAVSLDEIRRKGLGDVNLYVIEQISDNIP